MKFKEIVVAELSEEDKKLRRELNEEKVEIERMHAAFNSKVGLFWQKLFEKHNLPLNAPYSIKGNRIYRRELS